MFITNGKSIFGNTGLIISLLFLIILVYFSYNKCYVKNIDNFETTPSQKPTNPQKSSFPAPKNLRIKVVGDSVKVNFTIDNTSTNLPNSFILVLAQYDVNKNNTGNNKFYLSNESVLKPGLLSSSVVNSSSGAKIMPARNVCNIVNGKPHCEYVFTKLDTKDSDGNIYYYKLGVSALYNNNINSVYVTPYNISNSNKLFSLGTSLDSQNLGSCDSKNVSANTYGDTISTADGQYELIKSQLGNYPDNLMLESQITTSGLLTDLVDKSMAQALININVTANMPSIPSDATIPNTY